MKLLGLLLLFTSLFAGKPELFLLNKYSDDMNISGWYMSEKLDGVRAYWARKGKIFSPPHFFTQNFPKRVLDGELWSKRQDFSHISSIVNRKNSKEEWKELTYNVFEVPNAKGDLQNRLSLVKNSQYLKVIQQTKVKDRKELDAFLKIVESKGGEGVVVRDGTLDYYVGRNNSALKVKSYKDEECEVVGYTQGTGKYKNMLGALLCKINNNNIIKIGTGLTNQERINPPKISAIITFKYYGLTSKGNPRFPVFMRIRSE